MGRSRVKIQRLEKAITRQNTYSKRKVGLLKKAKEISVLCEVDLAVLAFSPGGKFSQFVSQGKDLGDIIGRLSEMSIKDRSKGKAETITTLQKLYNKNEHEVDVKKLSDEKKEKIMELQDELNQVLQNLADKKEKLSVRDNLECITDPNQLKMMEDALVKSTNKLICQKEHLVKPHCGRKPGQALQCRKLDNYEDTVGLHENINGEIGGLEDIGLGDQPYQQGMFNQIQLSDLPELHQDESTSDLVTIRSGSCILGSDEPNAFVMPKVHMEEAGYGAKNDQLQRKIEKDKKY